MAEKVGELVVPIVSDAELDRLWQEHAVAIVMALPDALMDGPPSAREGEALARTIFDYCIRLGIQYAWVQAMSGERTVTVPEPYRRPTGP